MEFETKSNIEAELKAEFPQSLLEEIISSNIANNQKKFIEFQEYWKATNTQIIVFEREDTNLYIIFQDKEIPENLSLFHLKLGDIEHYFYHSQQQKLYKFENDNFRIVKNYSKVLEDFIQNSWKNKKLTPQQLNRIEIIAENLHLTYQNVTEQIGYPLRIHNTKKN